MVASKTQAATLPGIITDRCIDPAEETGWFKEQHDLILDDTPAQVSYTSGTEGQPKGILLTHANIADASQRLIDEMQMTSEIREYVGVPATFSFGLARFRAVSAVGGQSYMSPRGFDPLELARMLKAGEVNALSAVPTLLRVLLSQPGVIGEAGRKLRWMEIGSQHMTADEKRAIRAMFPNARIVQHYGLTEASRSTFLRISDASDAMLGSVGTPVGKTEVQIGGGGRIRIRGPHVARARIDGEGQHDLLDAAGWLQTNDRGHMRDGHLFFDGRADDLINCGGVKIVPDQLEERIRARLDPAALIAVAKVPDLQRGDGVLVAVQGDPSKTYAVLRAATTALQEMGVAAGNALHVMAMDALPVTGTGKVQRSVLSERFAVQQENARPLPATPSEQVTDVRTLFQEAFPLQDVQSTDTFSSLGGDSLHYIQFSLNFEQRFGALPENWEFLSVGDLQAHLGTVKKTVWRRLEISTLTRAFFMICIVALHADAFVYSANWGAAYFLILLAGYSVARFQLPEIIRSNSVKTLLMTALNAAIPAILAVAVLDSMTWDFELKSLLLISNYMVPQEIHGFYFYFVEFYIQLILVAAVVFSIPAVRQAFKLRPLISALTLLVAVMIVDRSIEAIWGGDYNYHRTPWHYAWPFALGMVIAAAKEAAARYLAMALSIALVMFFWQFTTAAFYVGAGCAAMLFMRPIVVPVAVKVLLSEIAASSIFIFLVHEETISTVTKAFGGNVPWLSFALSLLFGVAASHIYFWTIRKIFGKPAVSDGSDQSQPAT